jgi:exonuclease VII large subunit
VLQKTDHRILLYNNRVSLLTAIIESNNVHRILNRGFTLVKQDNKYVIRSAMFNPDINTEIVFADGSVNIKSRKNNGKKK